MSVSGSRPAAVSSRLSAFAVTPFADVMRGLIGDGTADHPNAGVLAGDGYTYMTYAGACLSGACTGGNAGLLGNGGGGFAGGNGGSAVWFGNGGNGGAAVLTGSAGGNGGNGGAAGLGGRGGAAGSPGGTSGTNGASGGSRV